MIVCWTNRFARPANDERLLEVEKTRKIETGDRAFLNVAPFPWNRLPYSVRAYETEETLITNLYCVEALKGPSYINCSLLSSTFNFFKLVHLL